MSADVTRLQHHVQSLVTMGEARALQHGSQHNGHDEGGMRQADDDGGGWGLSRLWRRGDAGANAGIDENGNTLDGFGSLVAANSITANSMTSAPHTRSRAVFLPSAPNELKIGIQKCALLVRQCCFCVPYVWQWPV